FSLDGLYSIPLTASSTYWTTYSDIVSLNYSNWNTAYNWGDHSLEGYALLSGSSFTGDISVGGFATITSLGVATFSTTTIINGLAVDTDTLFVDSINNRVGIGTTTPRFALDVDGTINATNLYVNGSPYIGSQWITTSTGIYYSSGSVGIGTNSLSSTYAFDLFGNMQIAGNLIPEMTGATGYVSTRKIGDATHQFSEIWTDELYLGPHSLYVDGIQVISSDQSIMNFTADYDQSVRVKTFGGGNTLLESESMVRLTATSGIRLNVPSTGDGNISLENNSVGGDVILTANGDTNSSNILLTANQKIGLYAPTIEITGNINPGFTTGSIVFQGASGLTQDNGNLFYDDVLDMLSIGHRA
ncbi:MAG: hypothetical protein PHW42_04940, partial [Patescibacteria group bacterium]|nr:hypothetical protein [Patescibacteria group bacterium]MDD4695757.1 hypothetical protein [Patescibacteria group bacterium]